MLVPRTLTRLARQAVQVQSVRCMGAPGLGEVLANPTFEERVVASGASMDNMPSPAGDFKTEYGKRQAKYNMHLLGAIAFFFGTCALGYQNDVFDYFHPKSYPAVNIYDHVPEHDVEADNEMLAEMAAAIRASKADE